MLKLAHDLVKPKHCCLYDSAYTLIFQSMHSIFLEDKIEQQPFKQYAMCHNINIVYWHDKNNLIFNFFIHL